MRRNRIIYFTLLALSFLFAGFKGGTISYALLFGLLLITPVCFLYLLAVFSLFRIYQVVGSKHITAYEPIKYYFILKNECLLNFCSIKTTMYTSFSYVEDVPDGKEYELLPEESARFDTTLICKYRGTYNVGVKKITITDFLNLYKITYRVPEPLNLEVFPRVVHLPQLNSIPELTLSTFQETKNQAAFFDNSTRDYVPGDPMKGIHWKASAKTGKLQSRHTYGEQNQGIAIYLDTHRFSDNDLEYIPTENKCLEIALAITNFFALDSVPSTTYYEQRKLVSLLCESQGDMSNYLKTISSAKFYEDSKSIQTLEALISCGSLLDCQIVFFITQKLDSTLFDILRRFSQAPVVLYYVSDQENDSSGLIDLPNLHVIRISTEDDLTKVL